MIFFVLHSTLYFRTVALDHQHRMVNDPKNELRNSLLSFKTYGQHFINANTDCPPID